MNRTPETDALADKLHAENLPTVVCYHEMRKWANLLEIERTTLHNAIRNYRDAKGRFHTQLACERLVALLSENADGEARRNGTPIPDKNSSPLPPPTCSPS